jgi:hypothetical protein
MKKTLKVLVLCSFVLIALLFASCKKDNRVLTITYINETFYDVHMYTGVEKSESDNLVSAHGTLIDKFTVDYDKTCLNFVVTGNGQNVLTQKLCFGDNNTIKVYYDGVNLRIE